MSKPIIIAGGGIGGLSAALSLRSLGVDVVVFEQAQEIAEVGAGINFSPAAVDFLKGLGLDAEFGDVADGALAMICRLSDT